MAMDYIEKLNNGQPISKAFTSSRKTQYRDLYIVSARKKEALLHCSEEKKTFLSEWFDHIDDFNNFIYTKVYLGEKYNYIYPNGKLVSPYWSDEMNIMGQALWPISFNGKYNFIKEDGSLLLQDFADGIWTDEDGDNSFIIRLLSTRQYPLEYTYYRLKSDGETQFIGRNTKYDRKPVVDVYSSKSSLSDRLILHRRLFSLTVEDSYGKGLVSDVLEVIKHNVRPVTDLEGISEGNQGSLFSIKKEKLAQHIQYGVAIEKDEFIALPKQTRQGVLPNKEAKPGVLELFVMSQCPYGAMAENKIIEAQKAGKLPEDKDIRVRYIVNYSDKDGFSSLHGSAEWEENIRQLLIAKYYPKKFWKYLEIRNKDYRSSRWDKAMEEAGINSKKIMKKFDTEGVELLKEEAKYTQEYGVNASPSFLWEGKVVLDFGGVAELEGFEFMNPSAPAANGQAVPAGSC